MVLASDLVSAGTMLVTPALEIVHLPSITSQVVEKLKVTFALYGIPDVLESDNSPQLV